MSNQQSRRKADADKNISQFDPGGNAMAVYVVTWNLNKERSNYDAARRQFIEHLERHPNVQDRGLESVRWVESAGSALALRDDLRQKLDNNDRIFVSKLSAGQNDGWLNEDVWDWINRRQ
ncbi:MULTISPECIES: hypothetical protein [Xanthomonas]|nr:hypothetical protein [Xanthomonas citri]WOP51231.1 hypothetical protein R5576_14040 [Xanthomonas euvesicatoria]WPM78044.1 hypothetical protein XVT_07720 [Xanthomonas citri pv. viticola]